jgi:hypothetical protein
MLHKSVHNCQIAIDGADRDHRAVRMQLNLTLLEHKEKAPLNGGEIDWSQICGTTCDMTYDNLCEVVVHAGWETAVFIEYKCKGWYKASKAILIPAIEEKN